MFLIRSVAFEARADAMQVRTMRQGDHFGEIALLFETPRTATVRCAEAGTLWRLSREDFLQAMTGDSTGKAAMQAIAGQRLDYVGEVDVPGPSDSGRSYTIVHLKFGIAATDCDRPTLAGLSFSMPQEGLGMELTRSVGVAATFAAVAVGAASPASAAPEMRGHYIETETADNGRSATDDWYFTPCGDGCESVARKGVKAFGQAHLVGGQWVLDVSNEAAMCPDNTQVPNALSAHYTWDPNTLAGTVQTTADIAECGDPAGYQATDKIQLRQA